jgi:thiamine-monophosphate kinase
VSEWRFIEVLQSELRRGSRVGVRVDIGDDAAVIRARGEVALSVDASVEGIHFRRTWASWDVLAERAFEAALSDLAAMGSRPTAALVALALPPSTRERDVAAMARGLGRAARRAGCPVVGGNVTRASEVSFTTTVVGDGSERLTRASARAGDDVFVTGPLGAAAIGLAQLERARRATSSAFIRRWRSPRARLAVGRSLVSFAHACIDLSDGLLSDLAHVAHASGVAIEIDPRSLPRLRGHARACERLGLDPIDVALTGGEDYELAFTAGPRASLPVRAHRIGRVVRGSGIRVVGRDLPRRGGHDHFAR